MIVAHFLLDVNESNAYIVACEETREALLIDAAAFPPRIPQFLERHGLTLTKVFITHDHYDHTGGLTDVMERYSVTVYSGSGQAGGHAAQRVGQDGAVPLAKSQGRVIELPGHTPGSVGLVFPGMVFTGDALFAGSVGGTFSDVNQDTEIAAIHAHILTLPNDTRIYPGHGPASTVAVEKNHNPFLQR